MKQLRAVTLAGSALVALVALFAGCAAPPGGASAGLQGVPDGSGFLPDYSQLRPVPGRQGHYMWTVPDAQLRTYTRFMIAPMEIWIDRGAEYRGLSADTVQHMAALYQTSFRRALAPPSSRSSTGRARESPPAASP